MKRLALRFRWNYVQKRSLFHQEDHLNSRIFYLSANDSLYVVYNGFVREVTSAELNYIGKDL